MSEVGGVSPKKTNRHRVSAVSSDVRDRLDRIFPKGISALEYADWIFKRFRQTPEKTRSEDLMVIIRQFCILQRMSYAVDDSDRAEFYRDSKRRFMTLVFEAVRTELRKNTAQPSAVSQWERFALLMAASDMVDFEFWVSWSESFAFEVRDFWPSSTFSVL